MKSDDVKRLALGLVTAVAAGAMSWTAQAGDPAAGKQKIAAREIIHP